MNASTVVKSAFGTNELYSTVLLRPELLLSRAQSAAAVREALRLLDLLQPDDYTRFLGDYYRAGLALGDDWDYADISTVLIAAAQTLKPANYLEIGVRRGRSVAAVVSQSPGTRVYAADMWVQNYGHNPNPGPDFVTAELTRCGYSAPIVFLNGDSHKTIPQLLHNEPGLRFDLVTVDGDHSYDGALADLRNVLPALALGGVLVFDDICHPRHPELIKAWRTAIAEDGGILSALYTGLGYGVALGVRHWPVGGPPRLSASKSVTRTLANLPAIGPLLRRLALAIRS